MTASNPRVRYRLSSERPRLEAPQGKPLICHVVVNIEHWVFDRAMPRRLMDKPHGQQSTNDVANFSWMEYGLRCGMPRLLDLFTERRVPVTCALNSSVIDTYPDLAVVVRKAGWAFMGHGVTQRSLEGETDEVAVISTALHDLRRFSTQPVRSWLGPGLGETPQTPDHLAEAGVEFIYDWALDDLPETLKTTAGLVYAMPYALELNDVTVFAIEKQEAHAYAQRMSDAVATLEPELQRNPRVLTLALHPHIIAQPHRFPCLKKVLDMLQARGDTIFMTCDEIGDWYKTNAPHA